MKDLLTQLGLSLQDVAYLLTIPKATVQSWLDRNTPIPTPYQPFVAALSAYRQAHPSLDLEALQHQFDQALVPEERQHLEDTLERLKTQLATYRLALLQLQQNRVLHLRRWHLSQHGEPFFGDSLKNASIVQDWLQALERKSRYHLRRPAIARKYRRLRHKIAGLEAEIAFIEGELGVK